jgi:hypothetical protein
MLIILNPLRNIDLSLLTKYTEFKQSLLITQLMFLSELFAGYIFYRYNISIIKKKKSESKSRKITLIQNIKYVNISPIDKDLTIYLLIFSISILDCLDFLLTTIYLPKFCESFFDTLEIRLRSIISIFSIFLCYFLLKFTIYKHQKCSLICIFICLLIIIGLEYSFIAIKKTEKNVIDLTLYLILMLIHSFFNSFIDVIEKYLLDYNFINPFQMLMIEGAFGIILSGLYSLKENPFKSLKLDSKNKYILLISFLLLYFVLSGLSNSYRVMTNKIYSPITTGLAYCFLDPLLIIVGFSKNKNYLPLNDKRNIYFIANLVISILIVFFSCVYNEVFVLFCFGLEYDTHREISRRSQAEEISNNEDFSIELR